MVFIPGLTVPRQKPDFNPRSERKPIKLCRIIPGKNNTADPAINNTFRTFGTRPVSNINGSPLSFAGHAFQQGIDFGVYGPDAVVVDHQTSFIKAVRKSGSTAVVPCSFNSFVFHDDCPDTPAGTSAPLGHLKSNIHKIIVPIFTHQHSPTACSFSPKQLLLLTCSKFRSGGHSKEQALRQPRLGAAPPVFYLCPAPFGWRRLWLSLRVHLRQVLQLSTGLRLAFPGKFASYSPPAPGCRQDVGSRPCSHG